MKIFCIIYLFAFVPSLLAHPVAQGALDVQVLPEKVLLQARVSGEQIFVANTFGARQSEQKDSLADVWQRHGEYLLEHFKLFADDRLVTGRVTEIAPAQSDFVVYRLEFVTGSTPGRIRIEQTLLNEIEYTRGNPWEASFMGRIRQQERVLADGVLLSRKEPLAFTCEWSAAASARTASGSVMMPYVRHGIGHILSGYDHLLFIIALVLAASTLGDLIKVVTAFTVAHTITLALSVLNILRLRSEVLEPMIAASIVFVALNNLLWPERTRGWIRIGSAFFFGLFHGLGFAGGLLSATEGMSGPPILIAISAFSLGVELGHQMVVIPLFTALTGLRAFRSSTADREHFGAVAMRIGSLSILLAGTFYLFQAIRN